MIVIRDLVDKKDVNGQRLDPLCQYDFQFLFQSFASMCGLRTNTWSEPSLPTNRLQLLEAEISGKADILYCVEISDCLGSLPDILPVVAVTRGNCENKKQISTTATRSESDVTSTNSSSLPPHITSSLLGQHGGQLLLYHRQSVMKNNAIVGLIVLETKVTFTSLEMTPVQYKALTAGRAPPTSPRLTFTRPYDFMIKEDRHVLYDTLLELSFRQCYH